jgi:predicted ATPase
VIAAVDKEIGDTKRGQSTDNGSDSRKPSSFIHHKNLRYRIEIAISPQSGVLRVSDEYLVALGRDGNPVSRPQPFLERMNDRINLRMEGQAHPTYFDRNLDHAIVSRPAYAPHYPHLTALKKELQSWLFYYFEPRERMRAPTSVKEVRHIGSMGEELAAFLNTLRSLDPRQFEAVEKALHSLIPSISGIRTEVNKVGEVELSLIEGDVAMPARVLSEGTLRALGLLALSGVKEPPAVIGFEEPENGVHPRRIRDIAKILESRAESGNTQLIVTTHSPTLLDHIPYESLFVCEKKGASTIIEPLSARVWGPLARRSETDSALEGEEEELPVSQRMLRGDFGA